MKKLLTTLAVLTVVATPVFAPRRVEFRATGRHLWSGPPEFRAQSQINEEVRYDHAKGDVSGSNTAALTNRPA